jgi:hypothetical protein
MQKRPLAPILEFYIDHIFVPGYATSYYQIIEESVHVSGYRGNQNQNFMSTILMPKQTRGGHY